MESALAAYRENAPRPDDSKAIPLDVQKRLQDDFYARHYAAWLDESIPMLDGKTPREAARSSALRSRLVVLIKDLERQLARSREKGEITYSAGWMWAELGLDPDATRS